MKVENGNSFAGTSAYTNSLENLETEHSEAEIKKAAGWKRRLAPKRQRLSGLEVHIPDTLEHAAWSSGVKPAAILMSIDRFQKRLLTISQIYDKFGSEVIQILLGQALITKELSGLSDN